MDTRSVETLMPHVRNRCIADQSCVAHPNRASDDQIAAGTDADQSVDDSVIVVVLDGDDTTGGDDGNNDDSGRGGQGDDSGYGSGYDNGAQMRAHAPTPELSDERRDRVVVMLVAALAAGIVLLIGGIALASAAGWVQPACGGIVMTRSATCRQASQPYTTVHGVFTPDRGRYRLDVPVGQEQPRP